MNYLVVIPARGGSKGVPMKNIKPLNGKPLICYTIDAARAIASEKDICITTDDTKIIECVQAYGMTVPFKRPENLSSDTAGIYETLLHALDHYERSGKKYDVVVLLQPTSPFRTGKHVKEALALYEPSLDMVVSVKETASNPYYVLFEENEEGYLYKSKTGNFIRRQDCPKVWEYNGAIYVINTEALRKMPLNRFSRIRKYVMDDLSSLDIDNRMDWILAEAVIANQ